jgi:hypothetical protein
MPHLGQVLPIMDIRVSFPFIDPSVMICILFAIRLAVFVGISDKRIGCGGWIKVWLENTRIGIGSNTV